MFGLSSLAKSARMQSNSGAKRSSEASSPIVSVTEEGAGGEYAPIGTQRPRRLSLALLCLLLTLSTCGRLRRRPPVTMRWIHVLGFTRLAGDKEAYVTDSGVALSCFERIKGCWSSWTACGNVRSLIDVVWFDSRSWSPAVDQEQKRGCSWYGCRSRVSRTPKEDYTELEMYATVSIASKSAIA